LLVIRDDVGPEKVQQFSNLNSRLLADPVLDRKWGVLYFLYLLADTEPPAVLREIAASSRNRLYNQQSISGSTAPDSDRTPKPPPSQRDFAIDSPAFNDAFSHAGLLRLPVTDETRAPRSDRPVSRHKERKDKQKEDKTLNGDASPAASPAPHSYTTYNNAQPQESSLLRDLPFVLQGLSSTNLQFKSTRSLQLPQTLPVPIISLLHTLAEPCLLYKTLSEFVEADGGGLVGQSFRSALGLELRSYLKLVATLEGQIRRALAQIDESQPNKGVGQAGVTLKRCVYWTREATMGLRLMSLMVEESKSKIANYC
jgi:gamma-tubulin complex component 3